MATIHLQTWFDSPTPTLGWDPRADVLGGFPQPLNSMHLRDAYLPTETWSGASVPGGLLYASGPFGAGWTADSTDPAARASSQAAAAVQALDWLTDEAWKALPAAQTGTPPQLDLDVLFAPAHPAAPLKDQYVRRNIDRSSRYVLAVPGGLADRPAPVVASVGNLRLVGDWTRNGVDIPCIEATVVSALRAAESILGEDLDVLGV